MLKTPKIFNSKGDEVKLNALESKRAKYWERVANDLGYEVNITTLTTIVKKVSEQKFFHVAPADYVPVRVGEGAWSSQLTTYRSFSVGDQFETGIINTGSNSDRLAQVDAGVDSLTIKVINWAKSIGWTLPDLQMASRSGNWDLITAKEESRKQNWDLGIQRIAFLGARGSNAAGGAVQGLLNMAGVTNNTTVITEPIYGMTTAELKLFCSLVVEAFRSNCARTAWPTHFIVPESDYNGMAAQTSPDFPIKSILQLLREMFQEVTQNKEFKILPLAYGDSSYSGLGVQRYVLLNYDEKSVRMDIPVDYTGTLANTLDGFNYQNVAYGQFTGVLPYRPLEVLYFSY